MIKVPNKKYFIQENIQLVQLEVNQNTNKIQYNFILPSPDSYFTKELDSTVSAIVQIIIIFL